MERETANGSTEPSFPRRAARSDGRLRVAAWIVIGLATCAPRLGAQETTSSAAGGLPPPDVRAADAVANGSWLRFVRRADLRPRLSWLQSLGLRNWEAELLFGFEWDRQDISGGSGETRLERLSFTERLRVANRGYIIDPRLLSFRMSGSFGFYQEDFSSAGSDSGSNGELLGYEVDASLLPDMPYTLNVFASRRTDTVAREFAGTSRVLVERYGSSLTLREIPIESVLGVRRDRVREEFLSGIGGGERDEVRSVVSYNGTRAGEVTDFDLNYDFEDIQDKVSPQLSFRAHDGSVSHRYFFGPWLEKDLLSRVRVFRREGGNFDSLFAQAEEDLRVAHSESLTSLYDYSFLSSSVAGLETRAHSGSIGLQHQLYRSLNTTLRGVANYSELDDGHLLGYGGQVNSTYFKKIPWGGTLSLGVLGSYRIDEQELPGGERVVIQERHVVAGFQLVLLDLPRVFADTVVVTDEAGSTIYREGFDYRIGQIGELTTLERVPSGRLQDNQVILIDYRFAAARSLEFSTLAHGLNMSLDYGWIAFFAQRQESRQNPLSGDDETFLDDVTDQNAGAELRWTRPRAQASLLGEYRTFDSRQVAFRSPRLVESASILPSRTVTVTFNASQVFTTFSDPQTRETMTVLGRLGTTWRPTPWFLTDGFISYLWLDDTVAVDERLLDVGVRAEVIFGRLRVLPAISFAHRAVGGSETTGIRFTFDVIRKLF